MFIKPGLRDEYLAALHEFLVLARQEPGCIFLYANEAADERGTIVVFGRFRDPDAFNELLQRDYAQRYLKLSGNDRHFFGRANRMRHWGMRKTGSLRPLRRTPQYPLQVWPK